MTDIRDSETLTLPAVAGPTVTVNGVPRPWAPGTTVAALVGALLDDVADPAPGTAPSGDAPAAPTGVAVALDDAIVPRGLWASTPAPAGARLEVVTAVQGG